jgi:hypothetical protein
MRLIAFGVEPVGVVAVGANATGVIAIGQLATGVVAVGQLARGGLVIGQLACGIWAFGQLAVGVGWVGGQLAIGGGFALPGMVVGVFKKPKARAVMILLTAILWWFAAGQWLLHSIVDEGEIFRDAPPPSCETDPGRAC